jgi:hypothetical protein
MTSDGKQMANMKTKPTEITSRQRVLAGLKNDFRAERYPIEKYRRYQNELPELVKFVARLNGRDSRRRKPARRPLTEVHTSVRHSSRNTLRDHICMRLPGAKERQTAFHYLKSYALKFFILKLGNINLPGLLEAQTLRAI